MRARERAREREREIERERGRERDLNRVARVENVTMHPWELNHILSHFGAIMDEAEIDEVAIYICK